MVFAFDHTNSDVRIQIWLYIYNYVLNITRLFIFHVYDYLFFMCIYFPWNLCVDDNWLVYFISNELCSVLFWQNSDFSVELWIKVSYYSKYNHSCRSHRYVRVVTYTSHGSQVRNWKVALTNQPIHQRKCRICIRS